MRRFGVKEDNTPDDLLSGSCGSHQGAAVRRGNTKRCHLVKEDSTSRGANHHLTLAHSLICSLHPLKLHQNLLCT